MPVNMGKKKYKSFGKAASAVAKKKGISKERASAYVAATERKQGKDPRTGRAIPKTKTKAKAKKK